MHTIISIAPNGVTYSKYVSKVPLVAIQRNVRTKRNGNTYIVEFFTSRKNGKKAGFRNYPRLH